jgi:hypothetical protein
MVFDPNDLRRISDNSKKEDKTEDEGKTQECRQGQRQHNTTQSNGKGKGKGREVDHLFPRFIRFNPILISGIGSRGKWTSRIKYEGDIYFDSNTKKTRRKLRRKGKKNL